MGKKTATLPNGIYTYNQQLCRMFKHNKIKTTYDYSRKIVDWIAISKSNNNNNNSTTSSGSKKYIHTWRKKKKSRKSKEQFNWLLLLVQEKDPRDAKNEESFCTQLKWCTHILLNCRYLRTYTPNRYMRDIRSRGVSDCVCGCEWRRSTRTLARPLAWTETHYTHVRHNVPCASKSLRIHNILHYVCNFQLNFGLCLLYTHSHTT